MPHPKQLLESLGASALKSLSQNFLTSPHWAEHLTRIVTDVPSDEIWEIGPGLGALTSVLLEKTPRTIRVFEADRKLAAYLRLQYPRLIVEEGDFLKADLAQIAPEAQKIAVLSNLPYHLSSPILFRLAEHKARFPRMVLTFQKEFAARLTAQPRTPDYGSLSIVAGIHFKIESLGVLPKGAFYPEPSIASEALVFEPREVPLSRAKELSFLVKTAFAHRRKKLTSNLRQAFPDAALEEVLGRLGFGPDTRAEELSRSDYEGLSASIGPHFQVCET